MRGPGDAQVLDLEGFDALIAALVRSGYRVIGPTVRDGAIVYDEVVARDDLPVGWGDQQEAGRYRLRRREDAALFGYAVGPHSWKRYQLPPETRLWRARLAEDGSLIDYADDEEPSQPLAFLGVRSCELHAMGIMERVLGKGVAARDAFLVAVQCGEAGGTCFCASMGTGPRASDGFDLALTELIDAGGHRFVVEAGSRRGAEILDDLPTRASTADAAAAEAVTARTAAQMGRTLDAEGVHDLLLSNLEHPRWADVAERCLTCGNCTMVCPTCFCTTVEDVTELDGHVERHRRWDSCFTIDYSRMHGGSARTSSRARYRQWMTHKLATWIDQFGTSGCVGCGRCITWCPVGIDITEEVAAIGANGDGGAAS